MTQKTIDKLWDEGVINEEAIEQWGGCWDTHEDLVREAFIDFRKTNTYCEYLSHADTDFKQDKVAIATFGPTTAKAARDAGLRLDIEAPSEKYPSMTGALQHFLIENQE